MDQTESHGMDLLELDAWTLERELGDRDFVTQKKNRKSGFGLGIIWRTYEMDRSQARLWWLSGGERGPVRAAATGSRFERYRDV